MNIFLFYFIFLLLLHFLIVLHNLNDKRSTHPLYFLSVQLQ